MRAFCFSWWLIFESKSIPFFLPLDTERHCAEDTRRGGGKKRMTSTELGEYRERILQFVCINVREGKQKRGGGEKPLW